MSEYYKDATKGWICPKCGKVWAPSVEECVYCNDGGQIYTTEPYSPYTIPSTPYQWKYTYPYTQWWITY